MAKTSEKKLKKLRASQKSASTKAATAKSIAKAESKKSSSSSSSSKTTTKSRDEQIADIKAAAEKLQRDLEEGIRKGTIKSSKEIAEKEEKIKEKLQEAGEEYEYDAGELESSQEFQDLPEDEQEVVRNVFKAIAENNKVAADQLVAAFEAATSYANPYFKQKLRLAKDELERGFVAIDQEQEFKLERMNKRLADLKEDVAAKREFLTLEEAADLKEIERTYMQEQQNLRQNLAATGMSSSKRRVDKEGLLNETTGDLRESTTRRFGMQQTELANTELRETENTQAEIARLTEVAKSNRLDLFRQAEKSLGSGALGDFNVDLNPLGGITGSIEEDKLNDIISGTSNLLF